MDNSKKGDLARYSLLAMTQIEKHCGTRTNLISNRYQDLSFSAFIAIYRAIEPLTMIEHANLYSSYSIIRPTRDPI